MMVRGLVMRLEDGDPRGFMVWKSGSWEMGVDGEGHAERNSMEGKKSRKKKMG